MFICLFDLNRLAKLIAGPDTEADLQLKVEALYRSEGRGCLLWKFALSTGTTYGLA